MADQRTEGFANQAMGKAKEMWGKLTGSKRTQLSGDSQQMKGKAQDTIGSAKDRLDQHNDQPHN
jgi:uncharacterized protein YjbJ (UPF0337 family)